jgi:hypothetical protein
VAPPTACLVAASNPVPGQDICPHREEIGVEDSPGLVPPAEPGRKRPVAIARHKSAERFRVSRRGDDPIAAIQRGDRCRLAYSRGCASDEPPRAEPGLVAGSHARSFLSELSPLADRNLPGGR